jgi:uncharacterized tellurite resistance protein B-like protein
MMIHYLNGLALIASADGNICEKEKEYLKILINSFGLAEEMLETFVNFAENPDEDLVQDMMEAFATKDIKYNFMMDCMMISSRDGNFDESEKEIIEEYFEMFKITKKEADDLKYIFEMFHTQDGNALYRYFKRNEYMKIELFQYLLDYYQIDMAYEVTVDEKKLLEFEFFKPTFKSGKLGLDCEEIMTKPINNAQFCIFLNSAYMSKQIAIDGNGKVVDNVTKNIVMDLDLSKIKFDGKLFNTECSDDDWLKATGMTTVLVDAFLNWINEKYDSEYVYYVTNVDGSYQIDMSNFKINLVNEFFINRFADEAHKDTWYVSVEIDSSNCIIINNNYLFFHRCLNPKANDMYSNVSFRLMRKPKQKQK